ncbi:sialidase family protein [Nonomuraea zeae]|uniref:Exo-alpha-sialidase n=1 Tax=Nonomuraea zeae TaxID=1642303 RepID=A0A5S4GEM7_9ACTN|nr:sialidase family protein [Nonomuraea zeae]TMR31453.1 exo-alpha-sialidase [Nonomuraea zeae]
MLMLTSPASASIPLTEIGADPYANATSQHGTQTGPDSHQSGSTIVVAQQAGRFFDGGASGIAFATSGDGGASWAKGVLPGITTFGGGPYQRVSDPSVAYDVRHGVWLISSLALTDAGGLAGAAVLTSRSTDGGLTWGAPVTTAAGGDLDKSWISCDNTPASPFYGRCYTAFDDHAADNAIKLAVSSDGGLTWAVAGTPAAGLGGQPVVRPDGVVVVPYLGNGNEIRAFRSRDGGATWGADVLVSLVERHTVAGGLRASPLPSAETDASGTVYVVWQDCRFQIGCAGNDIVLSKSATGAAWSHVRRVTGDGGDHFIPGLGTDRATSGGTARLAVTYYRYPDARCTAATCRLTVGYTSSADGGRGWAAPTQLQGPMALDWLANTGQGRMAGDHVSTSVVPGGNAFPVFTAASAPSGGALDLRTYTVAGGLPIAGGGPTPLAIEAPVATGEAVPTLPPTSR